MAAVLHDNPNTVMLDSIEHVVQAIDEAAGLEIPQDLRELLDTFVKICVGSLVEAPSNGTGTSAQLALSFWAKVLEFSSTELGQAGYALLMGAVSLESKAGVLGKMESGPEKAKSNEAADFIGLLARVGAKAKAYSEILANAGGKATSAEANLSKWVLSRMEVATKTAAALQAADLEAKRQKFMSELGSLTGIAGAKGDHWWADMGFDATLENIQPEMQKQFGDLDVATVRATMVSINDSAKAYENCLRTMGETEMPADLSDLPEVLSRMAGIVCAIQLSAALLAPGGPKADARHVVQTEVRLLRSAGLKEAVHLPSAMHARAFQALRGSAK